MDTADKSTFDSDLEETEKHRAIIRCKSFLRKIYADWYKYLICQSNEARANEGEILEIGAGGGFMKEMFPEVITSDILVLENVDIVCSAEHLPFSDNSLRSIVMIDVFHHIPRPYLFLEEAQRCLLQGGKIVMIEPANTPFSKFVYTRFHPEPFDVNGKWEIEAGQPLSNSNQALPYIYFKRDIAIFKQRFPCFELQAMFCHTPFRYIISGGLSKPALLPGCFYSPVKCAEKLFGFTGLNKLFGMFYTIKICKK